MGKEPIMTGAEPKLLNSALFIAAERLKRFERRNGAFLTEKEISERAAGYVNQFLETINNDDPGGKPGGGNAKYEGEKRKSVKSKFKTDKKSRAMKKIIKCAVILLAVALTACDRENHFKLRQVGNNYVQHFAWWYNDQLYNINLEFPVSEYWHYRDQSKTLPYGDYTRQDKNFEYLKYVSEELNKLVVDQHLSDLEMANFVLSFAQAGIPYVPDPIGPTDYPRFPIETLADGGGDCEDKAALVASILLTYNIKSILIQVPHHEAVAVACSNCQGDFLTYQKTRYYIGETSAPSWQLGQEPDIIKYANLIDVLPVQRTAFLDRYHPDYLLASENSIRKPKQYKDWSNTRGAVLWRKIVYRIHTKFPSTI